MGFSFPMTAAEFFDGLRIAEMSIDLDRPVKISGTRGGQYWSAAAGDPIWSGSGRLITAENYAQAAVSSIVNVARIPGATFLAYDKRFNGPVADRDGSILGASAPVVGSIAGDRLSMTIVQLPVGYVLTRGDRVGIAFGTDRRALHEVVTGGTSVSGAQGGEVSVAVSTAIDDAVSPGDAISLVRPVIKAVLTNVTPGAGGVVNTAGASFEFVQDLG